MKLFKRKFYIIGNKPQLDWQRILLTAVLLIIVVSVYNAIFYRNIQLQDKSADISAATVSVSAKISDKKSTSGSAGVPISGGQMGSSTADKNDVSYIMELYKKRNEGYKKALVDFTR